MNELTVIQQQEILGKFLTLYGDFENPLFLAKEVAGWIEHSNVSMMLQSIDDDEKELHQISTLNNAYSAWFLTEDGVYEVLMQSRKPIAKQFKKEVKAVLKSIRKHGAYMTEGILEKALASPDFLIQLATRLKEEKENNERLVLENKRMKPKEIFADAVSVSDTAILIGELAKILKQNGVAIGQNRLFEWMRDNGYLIKRKGTDYNMPMQKSMEMGLFEIKERTINNPDGSVRISKTVLVSGKGQQYFINKFLGVA